MKKISCIVIAVLIVSVAQAQEPIVQVPGEPIFVQRDSIYIFINCTPTDAYDTMLGVVGSGYTDIITKVKNRFLKPYDRVGIIFTGFDFTRAKVILFKKPDEQKYYKSNGKPIPQTREAYVTMRDGFFTFIQHAGGMPYDSVGTVTGHNYNELVSETKRKYCTAKKLHGISWNPDGLIIKDINFTSAEVIRFR